MLLYELNTKSFIYTFQWHLCSKTDQIRHCEISARRTDEDGHGLVDLTAFNTDGFDVSGGISVNLNFMGGNSMTEKLRGWIKFHLNPAFNHAC